MRWAMPYPCCRPSVSSVFNTIRSRVPCKTSDLGWLILFINRSVANSPVDCQEERRGEGIGPGGFGDFGSRGIYTFNQRETPAHDFTSHAADIQTTPHTF